MFASFGDDVNRGKDTCENHLFRETAMPRLNMTTKSSKF